MNSGLVASFSPFHRLGEAVEVHRGDYRLVRKTTPSFEVTGVSLVLERAELDALGEISWRPAEPSTETVRALLSWVEHLAAVAPRHTRGTHGAFDLADAAKHFAAAQDGGATS